MKSKTETKLTAGTVKDIVCFGRHGSHDPLLDEYHLGFVFLRSSPIAASICVKASRASLPFLQSREWNNLEAAAGHHGVLV